MWLRPITLVFAPSPCDPRPCLCVSLLLLRTPVTGFGGPPRVPSWDVTLFTSAMTLFPKRSQSEVLVDVDWGRHSSTHCIPPTSLWGP